MKRLMILALGGAVFAAPLYAALPEGAKAPDFTTKRRSPASHSRSHWPMR